MKHSCYYIICFGCLWAWLYTFILFFGTNLLTGGAAQIAVFLPISVFQRKGILDGVKTERNQLEKLFLEGKQPDRLGVHVRKETREPRGRGRAHPPRAHPPASWLPHLLLDVHSKSPRLRLFQKDRSRRFHSIWTPFDIPFLRNTEIGKKQQFRLGLRLVG